MQKKVIQVDLNLVKEMETLWEKSYDDLVKIGANISDGCLKIEKEMMKLKSISTKQILSRLKEYEEASKRFGFPFESKYQNLKNKAEAVESGSDKVFSKMIQNSNQIQNEMGQFLDKL
jgi:hypothetical protein